VVDSGDKTRDLVDTGHSRSITNTPRSNRALDPLSTLPVSVGVGRGMERMSINAEDAPYGSLKFGKIDIINESLATAGCQMGRWAALPLPHDPCTS